MRVAGSNDAAACCIISRQGPAVNFLGSKKPAECSPMWSQAFPAYQIKKPNTRSFLAASKQG